MHFCTINVDQIKIPRLLNLGLNESRAPPPASPSMDLVAHVADSMPEVTETTDMTEVHTAGDVTFSIEDEDILNDTPTTRQPRMPACS